MHRTPSCIANMQDPDFARSHAPIDQIGVTPGTQDARALLPGRAADLRKLAIELDRFPYCALHIERTERVSLVYVFQDCGQIATRTRRIADLHRPWRFQSASISSSGTNSPRRASLSPSRIAARVLSSSGKIGEPCSVMVSIAIATAS